MATAQLTERQKEVKALLDKGKTPGEIADALDISENGVYQHMRRIRGKGGKPKSTAKRSTAKRTGSTKRANRSRSRSRASTRSAPTSPSLESTGTGTAANTAPKIATPLQAIQARKHELESELRDSEQRVAAATKALSTEKDAHEKLGERRKGELAKLTKAEAALRDEKPKPRNNGSGSRKAAQEAAKATSEPQAAPGEAPEPPAPQEPAPAAPEPEGDEAAALVGADEERPGVPLDPDFEQGAEEGDFGQE